MSADRVARSVALEQAYVYDVYEQLDDSSSCNKCGNKPWPKVQQFLDSLEAGSIVCDVGSGNGKYLNLNASVYTIGGDKSTKICEMTRATASENEVILLDNLSLPYRDDSLDGVLSIAVIHHFATIERRVCALRELARVMRIGGRIIISVWAMEQSSRRFESQDVLVPVPWPSQFKHNHTAIADTSSVLHMSEDADDALSRGSEIILGRGAGHYHCSTMIHTLDTDSCYNAPNDYSSSKSASGMKSNNNKNNNKNIKNASSSPASSSLSSPNETCYSFVRKAIQKLASGRPSSNSRPSGRRPWFLDGWGNCTKDFKVDPNGNRGARYDPDGCECCRELDVQDLPIELRRVDDEDILTSDNVQQQQQQQNLVQSTDNCKLQSMFNMSIADTADMSEIVCTTTATPTVICSSCVYSKASSSLKRLTKPKLVKQKQSICQGDTEEALDQHTDMLTVRKPLAVLKQRSLNEDHLMNSNARSVEKEKLKHHFYKQTSLNDDLIYQRQNSNNINSDHIRDSFFSSRRLNSIKTGFANKLKTSTTNIEKVAAGSLIKNGFVKILQNWKPFDNISTTLAPQQLKVPNNSADSCTYTNNNKDGMLKRDCADGCEKRSSKEEGSDSSKDSSLQSDTSVDSEDSFASVIFIPKSNSISPTQSMSPGLTSPKMLNYTVVPISPKIKQSSCPTSPRIRQMPLSIYPPLTKQLSSPKPTTNEFVTPTNVSQTKTQPTTNSQHAEDNNMKGNTSPSPPLQPSMNLASKYSVQQIPKFNKSNSIKSSSSTLSEGDKVARMTPGGNYPIVRHISLYNGKHVVKPLPKLLPLELFNPETDDKDSDSSAVSSPDSVDSVVSVQHKKNLSFGGHAISQQQQKKLIKAAVDVANSLDEAMGKVIRSHNATLNSQHGPSSTDIQSVIEGQLPWNHQHVVLEPEPWNKDCQKHLTDFADRLTEKLQLEISRYQNQSADNCRRQQQLQQQQQQQQEQQDNQSPNLNQIHEDPYIHRLSEELYDLNKLSAEIQKQNEYLTKLSVSDERLVKIKLCHKCRKCKCKCINKQQQQPKSWTNKSNEATTSSAEVNKIVGSLRSVTSSESCDSVEVGPTNSTSTTLLHLRQQSIESADCCCEQHSISSNKYSSDAYSGSTASLASCPEWKTQRGLLQPADRSESTDDRDRLRAPSARDTSLPTSQESLPSDGGTVGGEIIYHRFYHVFRERELDQLIEKYVENLHIISSYYDHASWCIVAEKVHVWTI